MVLADLHALRRFARETLPQIKTNLIDTGKLRYCYATSRSTRWR